MRNKLFMLCEFLFPNLKKRLSWSPDNHIFSSLMLFFFLLLLLYAFCMCIVRYLRSNR